jgi:hypothetical protein
VPEIVKADAPNVATIQETLKSPEDIACGKRTPEPSTKYQFVIFPRCSPPQPFFCLRRAVCSQYIHR